MEEHDYNPYEEDDEDSITSISMNDHISVLRYQQQGANSVTNNGKNSAVQYFPSTGPVEAQA